MGTFNIEMEIGDPDGLHYEKIEALVDSGASYTMVPASLLRSLGVTPLRRAGFELADGSRIELEVGQTWLQLAGRRGISLVVFADEGSKPLLGAVTLETLQLGIDPVGMRLVPVDALLGSAGVFYRT